MTREEAESLLDEYLDKHETMIDYTSRDDYIIWTQEAEDKATSEFMQLKDKLIELICGSEDVEAVSKLAVLDLVADYDLSMGQVVKGIHALPPVSVKQKIGHWIFNRLVTSILFNENLIEYKCSECGRRIRCTESELVNYPYCHCGAKMEAEESDEKGEKE